MECETSSVGYLTRRPGGGKVDCEEEESKTVGGVLDFTRKMGLCEWNFVDVTNANISTTRLFRAFFEIECLDGRGLPVKRVSVWKDRQQTL